MNTRLSHFASSSPVEAAKVLADLSLTRACSDLELRVLRSLPGRTAASQRRDGHAPIECVNCYLDPYFARSRIAQGIYLLGAVPLLA